MSGRPPGPQGGSRFPPRAAQMSEQSDWIERKRREIEEKNEAAKKEEIERKRKATEKQMQREQKAEGAKKEEKGTADAASSTKNSFNNDGSFMRQFQQRMKEKQKEKEASGGGGGGAKKCKVEEVQLEPLSPPRTSTTTPSQPPPPPLASDPLLVSVAAAVAPPNPKTKQQEDEWYKAALEKARSIAKVIAKTEPMTVDIIKEEPAAASDNFGAGPSASLPTDAAVASSSFSTSSASGTAAAAAATPAPQLPTVADELASLVAVNGDQVEIMARERNLEAPDLLFLQDVDSELYKRYRAKVDSLKFGFSAESKSRARKKSRWGDESDKVEVKVEGGPPVSVGKKWSQEVVAYAMRVFGSTDLEDHQWKQCDDQLKMSLVYKDLVTMQSSLGKRKYEYDSDEETDGGTWEHRARTIEMEKTMNKATELTDMGEGKHHIGDFIPPDQLNKFLAKYKAIKSGETITIDESDYQDNKINDENKGFKMLQQMGWNEGAGLGPSGQGITAPINQGKESQDKTGLGITTSNDLDEDDNEFDAYRKRMMLAYRFRPNPLNNPRRSYY